MTDATVSRTTSAAVEEKAKLQKHFGRFDMFFFLVCTLVGLDTIGSVASHGAQGFTWLIFLVPVFFIPYALFKGINGAPPGPGSRWRANFYRMDHDEGKTTQWDWAPVGPSFHEYRSFGVLIFD